MAFDYGQPGTLNTHQIVIFSKDLNAAKHVIQNCSKMCCKEQRNGLH